MIKSYIGNIQSIIITKSVIMEFVESYIAIIKLCGAEETEIKKVFAKSSFDFNNDHFEVK